MIHAGASPPERPLSDRSESRQVAELLPRVLEALPLGVALFELGSEDCTFRHGNREFARVLGLDQVPSDGASIGEVFHRAEHDAIIEVFRLVRSTREPQSYFVAEGGEGSSSNRIWNIDAYPLLTAGRVSHVLVLAEQTREKLEMRHLQQLEADRLRQKAEQLAGLEKAKSEFLRLASHELRGPAAMIGGYLSLIEDESLGPIPARLRPVLPMLRSKAAQINLLANEMVEAARLEDGRLQLKRKRVDLRQVVNKNVLTAQMTASPKHRVRFDDRVGDELWLLGDLMRLEIIIGNLLDNAVKYSPKGGDVTAQLSSASGRALLSVRDQGVGIAPQDLGRLFVRFSRIPQPTDVPGTGLGLYLARELARLHGGDISVVSKPGEGSEFTLSLPLEAGKK